MNGFILLLAYCTLCVKVQLYFFMNNMTLKIEKSYYFHKEDEESCSDTNLPISPVIGEMGTSLNGDMRQERVEGCPYVILLKN